MVDVSLGCAGLPARRGFMPRAQILLPCVIPTAFPASGATGRGGQCSRGGLILPHSPMAPVPGALGTSLRCFPV